MALLSWSNQYLIGNEVIDAEHQELFRRINAFHDHWLEKRDQQSIAHLLNQLVNYAQTHFRHEEDIMRDAGFPRLVEHQKIHESMIETIFNLRQSFEEKNIHLEMDTMKFVKDWLVNHIVDSDYMFRNFLARRKSSAETPEQ
ncbi:bacteriohemerythrin [Propionivibrio sp.]|uniref:bacteriohemerythrin n=1 Tax=Propionivibrio sp. TaxID=2212460 RepID=UPI002612DDBC|nr:bacteriohemerythrin [Propionivibrio sp.]